MSVVDDERINPIDFGSWGQTTLFAQSLSIFTCMFLMMRGGTLLILVNGVKGQGQLWHSTYEILWAKYTLQILPYQILITFKLHMSVVDDKRINPIDFGRGVKGQGQLWYSVY